MHACTYGAIHTRMYFYIHTYAHARGYYGCKQKQMEPPDVIVCVDLGIHTRLEAQASIQTHVSTDGHTTLARAHARTLPWNLRAHSYRYMYSYEHT